MRNVRHGTTYMDIYHPLKNCLWLDHRLASEVEQSCISTIRDFADSYSLVLYAYARVNLQNSLKRRLDEVYLSLLFSALSLLCVPIVFHNKRDGNVNAPVLDFLGSKSRLD